MHVSAGVSRIRTGGWVGLTALALAAVGLAVVVRSPPPTPARAAAVRSARADSQVREALRRYGPADRARVTRLDSHLVRVSLFRGHQLVVDAAVSPTGRVRAVAAHPPGRLPEGSSLAFSTPVIACLLIAFVLAGAVLPLNRWRNLDLLALLAFVVPMALLARRWVELGAWSAYPLLGYLLVRCTWVALRAPGDQPSRPLLDALTTAWTERQRVRSLAYVALGTALTLVALTASSEGISDVGYASMRGATMLAHGSLPYDHMAADVLHGDTYPVLAYAVNVPAAVLLPVHDVFDNLDGALYVAALASVAAAAGLYVAAQRAGSSRAGGLRVVLSWLCLPPVFVATTAGVNDLVVAACLAWALALAFHAGRSSALIAAAAWVKLVPAALLPLWLARLRGRALARATAAVVTISAACVAWLLAVGGLGAVEAMLRAISFQFDRGSLQSLWIAPWLRPLHLLVDAALLAGIMASSWRLRCDRALADDPRRTAALLAAVLAGVQIAAGAWRFAYLPWLVVPLLLALVADVPAARQRS